MSRLCPPVSLSLDLCRVLLTMFIDGVVVIRACTEAPDRDWTLSCFPCRELAPGRGLAGHRWQQHPGINVQAAYRCWDFSCHETHCIRSAVLTTPLAGQACWCICSTLFPCPASESNLSSRALSCCNVVASLCAFRHMVEAFCVLKMHITGMASTGQRLAAQLALPVLQISGMFDFLC